MHSTETSIYYAIIIAACILLSLLGCFMAGIFRYHRSSKKKRQEQVQADLMLMEKDRLRLSADLHDEFGVLVSGIKLSLHCMELTNAENLYHMQHAEMLIDRLMQKIRVVSADLSPRQLEQTGLDYVLSELVEDIRAATTLQEIFKNQLPPERRENDIHIFRIIQELVNNVLKHAEANRLGISLHRKNKKLMLELEDNGKGFEKSSPACVYGGMGLQNIARRVEILNGNIYLDTAPGKGTKYSIEIPCYDK